MRARLALSPLIQLVWVGAVSRICSHIGSNRRREFFISAQFLSRDFSKRAAVVGSPWSCLCSSASEGWWLVRPDVTSWCCSDSLCTGLWRLKHRGRRQRNRMTWVSLAVGFALVPAHGNKSGSRDRAVRNVPPLVPGVEQGVSAVAAIDRLEGPADRDGPIEPAGPGLAYCALFGHNSKRG